MEERKLGKVSITDKQSIKVVKLALKYLKEEGSATLMCINLNRAFKNVLGSELWSKLSGKYENEVIFTALLPEFYTYKPKGKDLNDIWFIHNKKSTKKRIKILKKVIKDIKNQTY